MGVEDKGSRRGLLGDGLKNPNWELVPGGNVDAFHGLCSWQLMPDHIEKIQQIRYGCSPFREIDCVMLGYRCRR